MRRGIVLVAAGVLVVSAAGGVAAQEFDPGLKVGATIPGFELQDQTGTPRSFDDLRGPNGLALLFFRSADW